MERRQFLGGLAGALGLVGASPAIAQIAPQRMRLAGLTIGINDYTHLSSLKTARQDAQSISGRLGDIGYQMVNVEHRFDTDGVLDGFQEFVGNLDDQCAAFVFLAGHGVQAAGRNYFLPANVPRLDTPDALSNALPLDSLLSFVASARPAQTIFVLDACRNATLGKGLEGDRQGLASTQAPTGCFIAYSAGSGEYALDRVSDDDTSPNGLFTRHLLAELQPEKTIYDVIAATRARVIPDAEAVGHAQHPAIYDQARRAYFVDGIQRHGGNSAPARIASMDNVGFIIAACDNYGCLGERLASPKPDAARLARILQDLGATVAVAANPQKQDLLDMCRTMGEAQMQHLCFMWMGKGMLQELQVCGVLESSNCAAVMSGKAEGPAIELLTHTELIKAFRPSDLPEGQASKPVPLSLFFDIGLVPPEAGAGPGEFDSEISLSDLPDDYLLKRRFHDVALHVATDFGQQKPKGTNALSSSPYVTALINALGRPGITMFELSSLIQREVENLTQEAQSPRLFGSREAERHVLVQSLLQEAVAGPGSAKAG